MGLDTGTLVEGGVEAQTTQALANLSTLLAAEGASLADVVKTTVFLRHIWDFDVMNEAYAAVFGDHRPARSAIQSPDFGRVGENARFMIEVAAYRG